MIDKIYFIGCGAVGYCLLEIFKKEKAFYNCFITIIEPKDIEDIDYVMENRNYSHIKKHLSRSNYKKLLSNLDNKSYIINVSVNVDSIMLLEYAKQCKAFYIDTSLEQYQDFVKLPVDKITKYEQFKQNNLYHQNLVAEDLLKNSKKTRIVSGGMNPGFINEYAKKALKEYAKLKGKRLIKGNYAKLGYELGLTEIQVVEYDTQKLKIHSTPNKFVSTWSAIGFQEEASDLVMLSLNNDDIENMEQAGYKLIKPTEGKKDTHIRFIAERGMNMTRQSIAIDDKGKPFKYTGYLIPHAEIITMSEFFQYKGNSPSIMYIYRPCDEGVKGLNYFRENNYKILEEEHVVRNKDIISGWDSIGALLHFKNGDKYIGATICGKKDADKLGFKSGATTMQVGGFMYGAIKWALLNPNKGLNNAETIPHKFIFKHAVKYMGKSIFKLIN